MCCHFPPLLFLSPSSIIFSLLCFCLDDTAAACPAVIDAARECEQAADHCTLRLRMSANRRRAVLFLKSSVIPGFLVLCGGLEGPLPLGFRNFKSLQLNLHHCRSQCGRPLICGAFATAGTRNLLRMSLWFETFLLQSGLCGLSIRSSDCCR